MKKKSLLITAMVACLSLASMFTSFAGEWEQDEKGWRYKQSDGTYIHSELKTRYLGYEEKVEGFPGVTWHKTGEEQYDDGKRVSCSIDGNGDGVAENYYFDIDGYLITNTTVTNGAEQKVKVNSTGAELDEKGNVVTIKIPQGEIGTDIGRGIIKQEFIDILFKGVDYVDAKYNTSNKDRSYYGGLHIRDDETISGIKPISFGLRNDKVLGVTVPHEYFFTKPNMSVYDISLALGVAGELNSGKGLVGYYYIYSWTLQENPKVVIEAKTDSLYPNYNVSINVLP